MRFAKTEEKFWKYVNDFLAKYDKAYQIRQTNSTLTAIYDQEKNLGIIFRKKLTPEEMSNLWIFSAVKSQVKKWLRENRLDILPEMYSSTKKNLPVFYGLPIDTKFLGTDMRHCFWRMAYNLGYVKQKLYERLIDEEIPVEKQREYKLLRNKALACLRSKEKIFEWQGTVRSRSWYEGSGEMEQLYNDIRNRCFKIMAEISKEIPEGFIKYKTDCIYYMPEHQKKVEEILDMYNMPFSTFDCIKIDEVYFEENYKEVKKM